MRKVYVGIDPGKEGAVVRLHVEFPGSAQVYDTPVLRSRGSAKTVYDEPEMARVLRQAAAVRDGFHALVVIEKVHAMPRQGVTSSFNFGRGFGVVEGVFAAMGRPVTYVSPAKWKKAMGLTADKGVSRRRAIEQWPAHGKHFARVKDDGRAEAALIALWHLRQRQGGAA